MSKLWLLLLFVATFQFVQPLPTEYEVDEDYLSTESDDFLEDPWGESNLSILKDLWAGLKNKYKKLSKEKFKKVVNLLDKKFCSKHEDFEEDNFESDEDEVAKSTKDEVMETIHYFLESIKSPWTQRPAEFAKALQRFRKKLCVLLDKSRQEEDVLEDGGDDEERGLFGKKKDKSKTKETDKPKKKGKWSKLGEKLKNAMKKGLDFLKNMGVKVNPLQCEEKTCKSCIIFKTPAEKTFCIQMRLMRTNKATYLIVGLGKEDKPQIEQQIKLGELPRCLKAGDFLGKICLKGLEGRAKSSKGQANVNFCLAILAEKFGVGCKFCAVYENKKVKVKFSPSTFAGGLNEDGDIVMTDENGEEGVVLDADEFEID